MADIKEDLNPIKKSEEKDPNYWNSLAAIYNDPEFHKAADKAADENSEIPEKTKFSRRKFFTLIGASAALAGAGCSDYRSNGEIIPYVKKPEEITLGKPNYYSSTCTACSNSCGILIKTREGRPIKVDGNPDHPVSKGKICSQGHANILGLYDQERLRHPIKGNRNGNFSKATWMQADSDILNALNSIGNKKIVFISHSLVSPTAKKVFDQFKSKFPNTEFISYELFNNEIRNSAWQKCYGGGAFPLISWDKAKIILTLEGDFLGVEGNTVENARLFAKGRDVKNLKNYNRLYAAEANLSLTGSNADYRFNVKPEAQIELIGALINEVIKNGNSKIAVDSQKFNEITLDSFAKKYSVSLKKLKLLAGDLIANQGSSIVYAGNSLPEDLHIAVNILNEALGNSNIYRTDESVNTFVPLAKKEDWDALLSDMNSGNVGLLIHYDSNPAYHLPDDFGYSKAIKNVPMVLSLTESENESSELANYVLPINHNFEAWGDAKTRTGFYSLQQPVISPIFKTRQKEAAVLVWLNGDPASFKETMYHEYLMANWQNEIYPTLDSKLDFKKFWYGALQDGVAVLKEKAIPQGNINLSAFQSISINNSADKGITVILRESYSVKDGRFANNGWLQELPHPLSKITWDNYAAISHATASKLGFENYDMIEVSIGNRKQKLPVFIQPGVTDDTINVELGYGRSKVGIVGTGVGFDAGSLMSKEGDFSPWIYRNAKAAKTGETYKLSATQEHHVFDKGFTKDAPQVRGIIKEGTVAQYEQTPNFLNPHHEEERSLYNPHDFPGVKWGMSIDLNKCIGCGECVVACVAENNIPIVGKKQVGTGRVMHWLRIDRYYGGTEDDPSVSTQPMLCQQCDHAPCENVCPVLATNHDDQGLNQMIYNRCIGTRYCSNNCPYKVRRFNFFNFQDHFKDQYQEDELFDLVYNPEVTVRSRGVMEKCSFCVQRIMNARSEAIKEGRNVRGSDVTTACQDACVTEAIHFGDMNDKNSEFYKYRHHELGYYILEELNTRPNVTYLAKLRNLHSEEV